METERSRRPKLYFGRICGVGSMRVRLFAEAALSLPAGSLLSLDPAHLCIHQRLVMRKS